MKKFSASIVLIIVLSLGIGFVFFPYNILDGIQFSKYTIHTGKYNELGDFVGGITAPFLSLVAVVLLYLTYMSQKQELRESRKLLQIQTETLDKQQFENTFFQLLSVHSNLVNSIDLRDSKNKSLIISEGRDCFEIFYRKLRSAIHLEALKAKEEKVELASLRTTMVGYNSFFKEYHSDIGHYFRNLYHIIKFVHNSKIKNKKDYTNLVRAQLSSFELVLLFYNCKSEFGNEKFMPLLTEYDLLKNMDKGLIFNQSHIN